MSEPSDTATKGLRGWWSFPPGSGVDRLIAPWEYRHLRFSGLTRIAGGGIAGAAGVVCLSYRAYGWSAFFLVLAALNLAGGSWYVSRAHASDERTARRVGSAAAS